MGAIARIALLLCFATVAHAQGFDGERFVPAVGAESGFALEHPTVPFHLGWSLGLFLDTADDPVTARTATGAVVSHPLTSTGTADLVGSLGLVGRLELGLHLPVHFIYKGDAYPIGGATLAANAGAGDLRFVPKLALVRTGSLERHVELALAVPISFPTGDGLALRGDDGITIGPELLFAFHSGRLGLGFDIGYRYRSQHPAAIAWGDELTLGPWLGVALTDKLTLDAELLAEKEVNAAVSGADFPVEILGGIDYVTGPIDLYAGLSRGLTDGIGDPDIRIIAGIRYRHGAPEREGFRDSDGDGILDKDDRCPNEAEDVDGFQDEDGCPEPDNDQDGIPDADDECPELSGDRAHAGCPAHTYVKIENGKIFIFGKVQFQTGSAQITRTSDPLLDQIAEGLNANPQVTRVRIEGHTDNVGDPRLNQTLSEARAASVKAALEKRGVDSGRLETRGLGETHPIAPNSSPGGRQKNRRVEFVIVGESHR
jgi:outer membrane protein OmpA-like peptidoglycan-associated protein